MTIKLYWDNTFQHIATADLISDTGIHIRKYDVANVEEFLDEYYKDRTRPVPRSPYYTEASHIATLRYYIQKVEDALKEPDDATKLAKVQEAIVEFNTPVAVA